jgi:deoxycytidylate deaminase
MFHNTEPKDCTPLQRQFMDKAAAVAFRSNMAHRHGCIIVLNGEIIARGFNHTGHHLCHMFSYHSEVDALRKIKRNVDLSGAEMYVVRIGTERMGNPLKFSRPCSGCTEAILKAGVGKVYYSWSTGDYTYFETKKKISPAKRAFKTT